MRIIVTRSRAVSIEIERVHRDCCVTSGGSGNIGCGVDELAPGVVHVGSNTFAETLFKACLQRVVRRTGGIFPKLCRAFAGIDSRSNNKRHRRASKRINSERAYVPDSYNNVLRELPLVVE